MYVWVQHYSYFPLGYKIQGNGSGWAKKNSETGDVSRGEVLCTYWEGLRIPLAMTGPGPLLLFVSWISKSHNELCQVTEGKISVCGAESRSHRELASLALSVFSGTGDPLSEQWKEKWWARFSDRHAQLSTFECALFMLKRNCLYFSPDKFQLTVTFFDSHAGCCPPKGLD